jgi:hypothetical protein
MDEQAAISRISELEDRVRTLTQDNENLKTCITNYQEFVKAIPDNYPDGREVVNAYYWVEFAKKELGYESERSSDIPS